MNILFIGPFNSNIIYHRSYHHNFIPYITQDYNTYFIDTLDVNNTVFDIDAIVKDKFNTNYQTIIFFTAGTWLGRNNKIKATTKEDYYVTVSKKDIRNISVTLNYTGPIVAPIQKGEKIAELKVKNKDEVMKVLPLYASEDLKKVNFFRSLVTSINYLIWGDV